MPELFEAFPYLENDKVIIRKMKSSDVAALSEICNNDNVYKYIPPFLYKKSNKTLETAIENLGGRDFEKKKSIIAGIYLKENPDRLVGLAEMFNYKKKENKISVGYRLNEDYWNKNLEKLIVEGQQEGFFDDSLDSVALLYFFWSSISGVIRMALQKTDYLKMLNFDKKQFAEFCFERLLVGCKSAK